MKKLKKVDLEQLGRDLDTSTDGGSRSFLDVTTGDIVYATDLTSEESQALLSRLEAEEDRYIEIMPHDSSHGFARMEAFVNTLPEGEDKVALVALLQEPKPFANFRDHVYGSPMPVGGWSEFEAEASMEDAREWLKANDLELEVTS